MENLIELMEEQEFSVGRYKTTEDKHRDKRIKRLGKFNEKTLFMIRTLQERKIPFTLCEVIHSEKQMHRITTDIFLPEYNIVMRQLDVDNEDEMSKAALYFKMMKTCFYPFYIRSNEDEDFLLMKLDNTIEKAKSHMMPGFRYINFIWSVAKKRKRKRIKAVKVDPIKKRNNVY